MTRFISSFSFRHELESFYIEYMQRVHPDLNNSEESLNRSIEIKRIFKGAFENIISNDVSSDIDDDIEEIVEGMNTPLEDCVPADEVVW